MGRFRERVLDLPRHFGQTNQDIEKILTSSERIAKHGRKIETLEFDEPAATPHEHVNGAAQAPSPQAPSRGEGSERRRNGGGLRQPDLLAGK
jgi:DNA anti-recombination protein RmuC